MSNQNKILIIGASVAVGCITLVVLGIGAMQFVSFRQDQQAIAQERELQEQKAALDAVFDECQDLTELVNRAQGFMPAFEENIQNFSANAAQVKNLADIKDAANQYVTSVDAVVTDLDKLAVDLESAQIQNEQLAGYRDRYVDVSKGFSAALTQASSAMSMIQSVQTEADLPAKIEESQQQTVLAVQQIQELSAEESAIIDDANDYCGEISDQRLDIQLGRQPSPTTSTAKPSVDTEEQPSTVPDESAAEEPERTEEKSFEDDKTFVGEGPTGYSLWLGDDDNCIYVKDLRQGDLTRLGVTLGEFKRLVKEETGSRCVFLE